MTLVVREAAAPDAPALARVMRAVGWKAASADTEWDRQHWQILLAERSRWTGVAEDGGEVLGLASVKPGDLDGTGHLAYLVVIPEAWGRGVGRTLLEAAVEAMRPHGWTSANLRTVATNERARKMYEAAGWHSSGRLEWDAWLETDMVEYEREL